MEPRWQRSLQLENRIFQKILSGVPFQGISVVVGSIQPRVQGLGLRV